jgi:hypothetical protein
MSLGIELAVNGGFDADTDWVKNGAVISDGVATLSGDYGNSIEQAVVGLKNGVLYELAFDVTQSTNGGRVVPLNGFYIIAAGVSTVERHTFQFQVQDGDDSAIVFLWDSDGVDKSISIDNVSIREVLPGGMSLEMYLDMFED